MLEVAPAQDCWQAEKLPYTQASADWLLFGSYLRTTGRQVCFGFLYGPASICMA